MLLAFDILHILLANFISKLVSATAQGANQAYFESAIEDQQ